MSPVLRVAATSRSPLEPGSAYGGHVAADSSSFHIAPDADSGALTTLTAEGDALTEEEFEYAPQGIHSGEQFLIVRVGLLPFVGVRHEHPTQLAELLGMLCHETLFHLCRLKRRIEGFARRHRHLQRGLVVACPFLPPGFEEFAGLGVEECDPLAEGNRAEGDETDGVDHDLP